MSISSLSRRDRTARSLVGQLESLDIYEEPELRDNDNINVRKQHLKVVKLKKTKEKLEKWFSDRKIPIRIVYGELNQVQAIHKAGVITFQYSFLGNQDQAPPTAWMIVHNISHALYDVSDRDIKNPFRVYSKDKYGKKMFNYMERLQLLEEAVPDTRSGKNRSIETPEEAFHEIFAQWVVYGKVKLIPNTPKNQTIATQIESFFRKYIDNLAAWGAVLYNISPEE